MKKRTISFLLVLALLLIALVPAASAASKTVKYVYTRNSKPLNVRSWPDTNAAIIGSLPNGQKVTVEYYTSDYTWAVITYNRQTAYVMSQYLVDSSPVIPTPVPDSSAQNTINAMEKELKTYHVVSPYIVLAKPDRATGWVNLRYAPSTDFGHAGNLYANTQLTVIAETTNWLQVRRNDNGVVGYVMRRYTISMGVGSGI